LDSLVHLGEHSLEFGLLFLQHLMGPGLRILPLLCGGLPAAAQGLASPGYDQGEEELLDLLGEMVLEEEALVVMGADLAHVGPQFGHPEPMDRAGMKLTAEADQALLSKAAQRDAHGFFSAVAEERDGRNICGLAPILAGLRILPPGPGRILDYGQWLDEKGQGGVTFAALAFDRA
jgi:AmmeMemoRadiSam system protein B